MKKSAPPSQCQEQIQVPAQAELEIILWADILVRGVVLKYPSSRVETDFVGKLASSHRSRCHKAKVGAQTLTPGLTDCSNLSHYLL